MIDAKAVAEKLKVVRISDKTLRDAGIDTEAAQTDLVTLVDRFGANIPDATIQRELVNKHFHGAALEKLAVLVFRAWESAARDIISDQKDAEEAARRGAEGAGDNSETQ